MSSTKDPGKIDAHKKPNASITILPNDNRLLHANQQQKHGAPNVNRSTKHESHEHDEPIYKSKFNDIIRNYTKFVILNINGN